MNKLLLASLVALFAATGANAQSTGERSCSFEDATTLANPTPENQKQRYELYEKFRILESDYAATDQFLLGKNCAQVENTIGQIVNLEKPILRVISEADFSAQEKLNTDTVNGIKAMLDSGNQTNVYNALDMMHGYLSRGEYALSEKGLDACVNNYGESVSWRQQPCDPFPILKKSQEQELKRLGLNVQGSPSEIYLELSTLYKTGTDAEKEAIRQFASSNIFEILPHNILAKVSQLNAYHALANQAETRRAAKTSKIEGDSTIVGNFTSIGERLRTSFWGWLGSGILWLFIGGLLARLPLPMSAETRKAIPLLFPYIMIAMLPYYAIYVAFGGMLAPILNWLPNWVSLVGLICVFFPSVVLAKRMFPKLRLPAFARFKTGASSDVTQGDGIHGSAHWTSTEKAVRAGRYLPAGRVLSDSQGFTLGRAPEAKEMDGMDTRLRFTGHMLTVAPNGSGKGIGAVIPTLLDYVGSCIVLDVKGENYAVTARYRREVLGHDVYLIDPFGVIQSQQKEDAPKVPVHRVNWLDRLDPDSPDVVAESMLLADMLVVASKNPSGAEAHFNDTARNLIAGLMVHVSTFADDTKRHIGEVGRLLNVLMAAVNEPPKPAEGKAPSPAQVLRAKMLTNPRGFGLTAKAIQAFDGTPEKERGSMMSSAIRHLKFLDDPRIIDAVTGTDFNIDELKRRKMTIYLVMPPNRLEMNARFVRAFFGQAIMSVMDSAGKPDYKVLFLLDEFAQLGKMDIVEEKLPLIRGYGGVFWLIVQNLAQIKETYPKWQNFVANCGAKQYFGTGDIETAKYISDSLGNKTVEFRTEGNNSSMGGTNVSFGDSDSQQFTGRPLLTPDEIMRLPREREIVIISGEAPYLLNRLNYLKDAEYVGNFDPNPYE